MSEDFQARAGREGRKAQEIAVSVLEGAGFTALQRNQVEHISGATVNGVMHENVSVVDAWASDIFPEELMEKVVSLVISELQQHTTALVIDDRMVLLTPTES